MKHNWKISLVLIVSINSIAGLKCFSCHYEKEHGHIYSGHSQCKEKSPSIRFLTECVPSIKKGTVHCSNSTLLETGSKNISSVTRICVEIFQGNKNAPKDGTCSVNVDDGFTTCHCSSQDGCNAEIYDASNDVEIGDEFDNGVVIVRKKRRPGQGREGEHGGGSGGVNLTLKSASFFTYIHLFVIVSFALFL